MRKSTSKLKSFYNENKTPVLIVLGLFLLWKLRGLFSAIGGVGDTLGTVIGGATAKIQVTAQAAADKAKLDGTVPKIAAKPYQFTAADTSRYRAAAEQCATALGTMPGQLSNVLFTDDSSLYAAVKPYGKQSLGAGGKVLVTKTGAPVLRPLTGRYDYVIAPFYKELTGRSLQVDLDAAFPAAPGFAASADFKARCDFYRKHIRV
jgi:hypothetical protein